MCQRRKPREIFFLEISELSLPPLLCTHTQTLTSSKWLSIYLYTCSCAYGTRRRDPRNKLILRAIQRRLYFNDKTYLKNVGHYESVKSVDGISTNGDGNGIGVHRVRFLNRQIPNVNTSFVFNSTKLYIIYKKKSNTFRFQENICSFALKLSSLIYLLGHNNVCAV